MSRGTELRPGAPSVPGISGSERGPLSPEMASSSPVPVTVLSGFLGSGKTTLLKALLSSGQVRSHEVGLIVNDLAEVNVDARLLRSGNEEGHKESTNLIVISEEMHGACACCTGSTQLLASICRLAMRTPRVKHIIVECSGMSDPGNIVKNIFGQESRPEPGSFFLSAVVTVLDASALSAWISSASAPSPSGSRHDSHASSSHKQTISELFVSQIENASLIVVHKVDRVSVRDVASCVQFIRSLVPKAGIECARFGVVDPEAVLYPKTPYFQLHSGHGYALRSSTGEAPISLDNQGASEAKWKPQGCGHHFHGSGEAEEGCPGSSNGEREERGQLEGGEGRHYDPSCSHCAPDQSSDSKEHSAHDASDMPRDVRSFVFRAYRPFHPDKLQALMRRVRKELLNLGGHAVGLEWEKQEKEESHGAPLSEKVESTPALDPGASSQPFMRGVLRSKGLVWVAPNMDLAREWAQCRGVIELQKGQAWASLGHEGEMSNGAVEPNGEDKHGGRRQEIVFIGTGAMDENYICHQLSSCLLPDDLMELGPMQWKSLLKDKIALTLSGAARTEAARQPTAHGSMCPCCDPQLKELLGKCVQLF